MAEQIELLDATGQIIPTKPVTFTVKKDTFFGPTTVEQSALDLGDWLKLRRARRGDSLLITVVDWETKQNKPRYRYCRHCKAQGKKIIATWICLECSNREQTEVLICEDCADEHHPEHYLDDIIY